MSTQASNSVGRPLNPPYPLNAAIFGGIPKKSIDDPATAVFLLVFILGAIAHMAIFKINNKQGRKFIISMFLFGFCLARIATCTMRLVWASYPTNIRVGIASQILVQTGIIILYIVNLIFAQRVIRATYPDWAWKRSLSIVFKMYCVTICLVLIALIVCSVQSFYTLDKNIRRIDRDVQLFGSTYFAVAAFLPLPILLVKLMLPAKARVEKFGEGRFRTKIMILVLLSVILTLEASFKAGTSYLPRPNSDPAWYHSRICLYLFNFTIEIIAVCLYAIIRVDKRFLIPNGSHGPGHYTNGIEKAEDGREPSVHEASESDEEEEIFYDAPEHFRNSIYSSHKSVRNSTYSNHNPARDSTYSNRKSWRNSMYENYKSFRNSTYSNHQATDIENACEALKPVLLDQFSDGTGRLSGKASASDPNLSLTTENGFI